MARAARGHVAPWRALHLFEPEASILKRVSPAFGKTHDSCRRRPDHDRAGLCIRIGAFKHVEPICSEYTRGNAQLTGPEPIGLVHPVHPILAFGPLPNVRSTGLLGCLADSFD